jgi:hypothetical protein
MTPRCRLALRPAWQAAGSRLLLALACAGLPGAAQAAQATQATDSEPDAPDGSDAALAQPAAAAVRFGQLPTGASALGEARVPVMAQPLRELGNRTLLPPRASRSPLQARLAVMLDHDNNLLLTPEQRRGANALVLAPGLNWQADSARRRAELDASLELLRGTERAAAATRLDAASLQAQAWWRAAPATTVDYQGQALRSHDAAGSLADSAAGPGPGTAGSPTDTRERAQYDLLRQTLGLSLMASQRTELAARWTGSWARATDPAFVRTQVQDLELSGHWLATPLQRLGLRLRQRQARFADSGQAATDPTAATNPVHQAAYQASYQALWLQAEQQLGRRLLASASAGQAQGDGGHRLWLAQAGLRQTWSQGEWSAAAERDVSAPNGLGQFHELRSLRLAAAWQPLPPLRLDAAWQVADYRPLGAQAGSSSSSSSVRSGRPRLAASWALSASSWCALRYQRVDDQALASGVRRRGDRLLATLLWRL